MLFHKLCQQRNRYEWLSTDYVCMQYGTFSWQQYIQHQAHHITNMNTNFLLRHLKPINIISNLLVITSKSLNIHNRQITCIFIYLWCRCDKCREHNLCYLYNNIFDTVENRIFAFPMNWVSECLNQVRARRDGGVGSG